MTGVHIKETYQKNDTKFVSVTQSDNHEYSKIFEADQLLMATGRKPNTEDLQLEMLELEYEVKMEQLWLIQKCIHQHLIFGPVVM